MNNCNSIIYYDSVRKIVSTTMLRYFIIFTSLPRVNFLDFTSRQIWESFFWVFFQTGNHGPLYIHVARLNISGWRYKNAFTTSHFWWLYIGHGQGEDSRELFRVMALDVYNSVYNTLRHNARFPIGTKGSHVVESHRLVIRLKVRDALNTRQFEFVEAFSRKCPAVNLKASGLRTPAAFRPKMKREKKYIFIRLFPFRSINELFLRE